MKPIQSPHNPKFKAAIRLHASRGRKQQGRFLVHGLREVGRALNARRFQFSELYVCADLIAGEPLENLLAMAEAAAVPVFDLPLQLFSKLTYGDRSDGVIAVAYRSETSLSGLSLPSRSLMVVAEGIEKPGNLGAVARTVDGAGAHALISADPKTDFFHPNAIRSSLGTLLCLPIAEAASADVVQWLLDHQFSILAARVDGASDYRTAHYSDRVAVVLGNEASGLTSVWNHPQVTPISLPMRGAADSLNISAAAAILTYYAADRLYPV